MKKVIIGTLMGLFVMTCSLAGSTPQTGVTVLPVKIGPHTTYNVKFHTGVNDLSAKVLVDVFQKAKSGDNVKIDINSPGGSLKSLLTMLKAMEKTPARVSCHITEFAASAAAILAWQCPSLTTAPKSIVLYHKVAITVNSFLFIRLTSNAIDKISASIKVTDVMILQYYLTDAMNEEELERYTAGYDVAIPAETVVDRHNALRGIKLERNPQEDIDKATRPIRHTPIRR